MTLSPVEQLTSRVYGDSFKLYDIEEFEKFLEPLKVRYQQNNIDPQVFKGKRCLDAGFGSGRGSIFMAQNGASEVVGIDLSEKNVQTAQRWASHYGYSNMKFYQGNLQALAFEDESFDIVWCNGVLHHSDDPNTGLDEISRVLKVGGYMWLYLYGSGGVYWNLVDVIRRELKHTDSMHCLALLLAWQVPYGRVAEYIDDWYVPHCRRYTIADLNEKLVGLGFDDPQCLTGGTPYDTSYKVHVQGQGDLFGEGDLRYFAQRTNNRLDRSIQLPDINEIGSAYQESAITLEFVEKFNLISQLITRFASTYIPEHLFSAQVGGFRSMQMVLRDMMSEPNPFDVNRFNQHLDKIITDLSLD